MLYLKIETDTTRYIPSGKTLYPYKGGVYAFFNRHIVFQYNVAQIGEGAYSDVDIFELVVGMKGVCTAALLAVMRDEKIKLFKTYAAVYKGIILNGNAVKIPRQAGDQP